MVTCPFDSPEWVCNGRGDLCFRCAANQHDNLHPDHDVDDCLECRLPTLQFSPSCRGQARNNLPPAGTAGQNSWEQGFAMDERGMPFLDGGGLPIPVKRFAENRSRFEEARRRNSAGVVV